MEFNIYAILIALIIIIALILFVRRFGEDNILSNLLHSIETASLPAGLITGIIYSITTDVYIIYADGSHEEKNVLFSCEITDSNGFRKELAGLGLSNKFIYNGTSLVLVEYPAYYGDGGGNQSMEPPLFILPGITTKTSHRPDFYFEEPDKIDVEKGIFDVIYEFFAGSSEERWIIEYAN